MSEQEQIDQARDGVTTAMGKLEDLQNELNDILAPIEEQIASVVKDLDNIQGILFNVDVPEPSDE